jgi:hypothetical protein
MLNNSEMYKIHYSSGQGKVEPISVLEKQGNDWVLLKDSRIEDMLIQKFLKFDHYNANNSRIGYGSIVISDKLTFITGNFEIPDKK